MRDVVVLGTGTLGRLARRYFEVDAGRQVLGFATHARFRTQDTCDGLPVVDVEALARHHPPGAVEIFVAAGYTRVNRNRSELFQEVRDRGYDVASYVSSQAMVWPSTPIGPGSFVFEGVVIQPDATIGQGVVIWSGSVVCHDAVVDDFCFLASNVVVSGHVQLGHHTFAGANSTFRDRVATGPHTVVGTGAVITRNTEPRAVHSVRGTPARGDDSFGLEHL